MYTHVHTYIHTTNILTHAHTHTLVTMQGEFSHDRLALVSALEGADLCLGANGVLEHTAAFVTGAGIKAHSGICHGGRHKSTQRYLSRGQAYKHTAVFVTGTKIIKNKTKIPIIEYFLVG